MSERAKRISIIFSLYGLALILAIAPPFIVLFLNGDSIFVQNWRNAISGMGMISIIAGSFIAIKFLKHLAIPRGMAVTPVICGFWGVFATLAWFFYIGIDIILPLAITATIALLGNICAVVVYHYINKLQIKWHEADNRKKTTEEVVNAINGVSE
jgi:predicted RND superfamily exporter protein